MTDSKFSKRVKTILSIAVLLVFSVWLGVYVRANFKDFSSILKVPLPHLLTLYGLFAGILITNGLYTRYALLTFDIRLEFKEWLALSVASVVANYLISFRGGAGVRAVYLKRKYQFSFSDFLSTLSSMYLIYFIISGSMGLFGMVLNALEGMAFDPYIGGIFFSIAGISLAIMLFDIRLPAYERFPLQQIAHIINGWRLVRQNKALMAKLMLNSLMYFLFLSIQTKVAFDAYGVQLTWGSIFCFSAAKAVASLASITPGSIGVVEWVGVYLGKILTYTPSEALMAQALMRSVTLTTLLAAGPVAYAFLGSRSLKRLNRT
jgi:uncharacterized membrane protein YbhN (UPF0104 family)